MVNQQRNSQVRDRLATLVLRNMINKSQDPKTIDIEYEDVTDELRKGKKQIPISQREVH